MKSNLALNCLLIFSIFILLVSATFGFQSYDFFTLWGMHPKWVWATGNFWISGLDLPAQIPYQSLFGSILGSLLHWLTPQHYPELTWNFLIFATIFAVLASVFRVVAPVERKIRLLLLLVVFFMLKPGELKQTLMGGYSDLLLSIFLWRCFESALKGQQRSWFWALGALLLKPAALSWLAVGGGAAVFGRRSVANQKALINFLLLPVGLALVAQILRWLYLNHTALAAPSEATRSWQPLISFELQLRLPLALLAANNALVGLAFVVYARARREFWFSYLVIGTASLIPFYIFLMGSTAHESYASIHRYTLCLLMPPVLHFVFHAPLAWTQRPGAMKALAGMLLLLSALRTGEEAQRNWSQPWAILKATCRVDDVVCLEAEKIRLNPSFLPCREGLSLPTDYLESRLGRSASSLERLRLAYLSLPQRLYEEGHLRYLQYVSPRCRLQLTP